MKSRHQIRAVLYYCGARWLPSAALPGGHVWRAIRARIAGPLLQDAGRNINLEHGAYFGDGSLVTLGDRSGIGVNCRLHGPVTIGRDVMMGPDVVILAVNHGFADHSRPMIDQGYGKPMPVKIGNDVWIGTRAIILPGVQIGDGAVVGAGAVVSKNVPPGMVVAGNPAREIRSRKQ